MTRRCLPIATLSLALLAGCTAVEPTPSTSPTAPSEAVVTRLTVAEALAAKTADHDDGDVVPDAAAQVPINLDTPQSMDDVRVGSGVITVTAGGSYRVTGTIADGELVVDAAEDATVHLLLDGASISHADGPAIRVVEAGVVVITLAHGSENTLADGRDYAAAAEDAAAVVDSTADLTIAGSGALTVAGSHQGAITSTAGLVIRDATVNATAAGDGITGEDYLVIDSGVVNVTAGGDALKAGNETDPRLGYLALGDPTVDVQAAGDGLSAGSDVLAAAPSLTVLSGGGSTVAVGEDDSAKAIKAVRVVADAGDFTLDAAEDGVNADDAVVVNGGTWEIAVGDDGIHGDRALTITGGTVRITRSEEALEAETLAVTGGTVSVTAADDGLNASDSEATTATSGVESTGNATIVITGGDLTVDALGDGLDANGSILLSGGHILVHGPTRDDNAAIDYDKSFQVTGGTLLAGGSARMAQAPSPDSPQRALMFDVSGRAGTHVEFVDPAGTILATYIGSRAFANVVVSTPEITPEATYQVRVDGTSVGTTTTADAVSRGPGRPGGGGPAQPNPEPTR